MNYSRCESLNYRKDCIVGGRQRYYCKGCGYRFAKSDVKYKETPRVTQEMYLEGLGFRAIGRLLKINYAAVYYWVKEWGEKVTLPKKRRMC